MATLRQWFTRFVEATGELPDQIVMAWEDEWSVNEHWPTLPDGVVWFPDLPAEILDQDFDSGYGGNESPNLCAWSSSWVIFSDNYDGAEHLCFVPRNPRNHTPIRPGGG